jgi:DNA-binding NarL/FixJ family response regulator
MMFLIADDSARMRFSIRQFLMTSIPDHTSIVEAADGARAIEVYEQEHPDWVLMDIKMPTVDGLAASKAILASHPEARIIILTSYDDAAYRKAAKEAGTYAFVLKEHLNEISTLVSI